jgi:hypothetical protein
LEFPELVLVLRGLLGHGLSRKYTCKTDFRYMEMENFDTKKMREERNTGGSREGVGKMKFSLSLFYCYILTHLLFYPSIF